MLSYDDLASAAAGEERDALMRAFAEDVAEASGRGRGVRGLLPAERPVELARALRRDRRVRRTRAPAWSAAS